MFGTIIGLVAGFVGGLFYSRGKADPVQAAWFDLRRSARATERGIGKLAKRVMRRTKTINCESA